MVQEDRVGLCVEFVWAVGWEILYWAAITQAAVITFVWILRSW